MKVYCTILHPLGRFLRPLQHHLLPTVSDERVFGGASGGVYYDHYLPILRPLSYDHYVIACLRLGVCARVCVRVRVGVYVRVRGSHHNQPQPLYVAAAAAQ